ncbi:nitroreductase family protein [Niameybacter massiliensis]|uniref:nitroreductase family protein n=1 Tax=Niameybacter massiliensis TaxID=1658108 RepID=UPI0006B48DFC|nr:nitroreductase family protein [Niameybacter massiliensis]
MKEIFSRASVRKFKERKVEREKIEKLLQAAMAAPSAGNQQPWEFIVVEAKETLCKLSGVSPYARSLAEAPLAIVVLANKKALKYLDYWQQDLGAATQNMLLEAVHLELGGVWLGIAPLEERMQYVSEVFNLPEYLQAYAIVPFGYPANEPKPQNRYEVTRVHFEVFE